MSLDKQEKSFEEDLYYRRDKDLYYRRDKDVFESIVTMLGFEKKEDDVDKTEKEEKQE